MNNNHHPVTNARRTFGFPIKMLVLALALLVCVSAAEAKGRKFGLFVGINKYTNGINPLSGCVNDAKNMQTAMVSKYAFNRADTTLLTDAQATRASIIGKIKMYEKMAGAGDIFVFHYSGHGTLFPDANSEEQDETEMIYVEADGEVLYERGTYDSAIVPIDANDTTSGKPWQNLILDDELYAMLAAFTKKGAQVVFVSDSCHSGSVARAENSGVQVRAVPLKTVFGVRKFSDLKLKSPATRQTAGKPPQLNGLYLTLTGSQDNEFSLDAGENGVPMGLFTSTLLKTLNKPTAKKLTYAQLINTISPQVSKASLEMQNDQNPQLDSRFGNPDSLIFSLPRPGANKLVRP
jgi:hypothetical protein